VQKQVDYHLGRCWTFEKFLVAHTHEPNPSSWTVMIEFKNAPSGLHCLVAQPLASR